ncbi:MAG: hypothetical protein OXC31_13450, partial [Spirochaetaceae bacterium]|nr:hypothetical protein [Spirochaetaceae bacterium]
MPDGDFGAEVVEAACIAEGFGADVVAPLRLALRFGAGVRPGPAGARRVRGRRGLWRSSPSR